MQAFSAACLLPHLRPYPNARRCWIAYSGGMDSEVLLHATASLSGRLPAQIRALHLDHGLHPDSGQWVDHCRRSCNSLGVPLSIQKLRLAPTRGESLEALARAARYQALAEVLEAGDLLLAAHHLDDQAETLLLALMRGSGARGLAAMPAVANLGPGLLVRPLLEYSRAQLLDYARRCGLTCVEDPSNWDLANDRNFLRHRVLPLLAERWPSCAATISRSAGNCADAEVLIDGVAERELAGVAGYRPHTLSVSGLQGLVRPLCKAVLRHWISVRGLPTPDSTHLGRIIDEALTPRLDAKPLVAWAGCEVRRYRDDLFALAPLPAPPGPTPEDWREGMLRLPAGLGTLAVVDGADRIRTPDDFSPGGLVVRFGVRGLDCKPPGRTHHRALKKLCQEAGIPSWLRPYLPLVFAGESLRAIGGLWVCDGFGPGDLRVRWWGHPWEHYGFFDRAPPLPATSPG